MIRLVRLRMIMKLRRIYKMLLRYEPEFGFFDVRDLFWRVFYCGRKDDEEDKKVEELLGEEE